jgi:hypothetical protein
MLGVGRPCRPTQDEIAANWERARRNEPLLGIDPLA